MLQFGSISAHAVARASDMNLVRTKPLRFDPELINDLRARHERLAADVAALGAQFAGDVKLAAAAAVSCAEQLNELRRWEAIRLYPVISRGVCGDAAAERQWVVLRFVINGLAHRLLRSMEDLGTLQDLLGAQAAVDAVLQNLAAYRQRNEAELYPLYELMDPVRSRIRA